MSTIEKLPRRCNMEPRSPSDPRDRAWVACISGTPACAWDSRGRRLLNTQPLPAPHPAGVHYGGCPGDVAHRLLSAEDFGALLGFELSCSLMVLSPRYHREIPLHNLPEEALASEHVPPAAGPAAAELRRLIRECASCPDLFVAPDAYGGHGLFAAAALPAHTYLGEYSGEVTRSKPFDGTVDEYIMRFPDASHHISGKASGSLQRFSNHSAAGTLANNSAMRAVLVDGSWHMIQQTTRAVAAREELRHDYGPGFDPNSPWIGREPIAAN